MRELGFEAAFRGWVAAQGMGWEAVEYERPAAGGGTVGFHLTPARPPLGLVLVVHGAGNDALFSFVGLFKQLLRRGFSLFSFHLDGHGRGCATRFSAAGVGDAVQAALGRSGAAAEGLPVHGLGVSLGGSVLLHSLPRLAPPLASATLMVAPLRIQLSRRALLREVGPSLLTTAWRQREHCGMLGLIPSFGPFKREIYPLRLASPRPGAFGYVEALNEEIERLDLEQAARQVRTPTLLLYGERDAVVPPEQGEALRGWIPDARLLRVPGGTHLTTPLAPAAERGFLEWLEERTPRRRASPRRTGSKGRGGGA